MWGPRERVHLTAEPPALTLGPGSAGGLCEWRSIDGSISEPLAQGSPKALAREHALCLTGDGLAHLQAEDPQLLLRLIPYVQVFARVAPKQKVGTEGGRGQVGRWGYGTEPSFTLFLPQTGVCHHQPEGAGLRDPHVRRWHQ